jgi:DNA processing protein
MRAAAQEAGLSAAAWQVLEQNHGAPGEWWGSLSDAILEEAGIRPEVRGRLVRADFRESVRRRFSRAIELGFRPLAAETVPGLADLPDPPLILLARGEVEQDLPAAAIVGARSATAYGLRTSRRLASAVARAGGIVISGLARGIDGAAHRGALDVDGLTLAVLGAGPDHPYPPEHAGLLEEIGSRGGLLTEHLPGVPPRPHHFPRRNRILVARAHLLILVEARIRSGSLTSVRWAADLGRPVLVVPGPIDSALSEGPLQLLFEGAEPLCSVAQLVDRLGLRAEPASSRGPAGPAPPGGAAAGRLLALLGAGPLDADEIVRHLGEAPGRILALLLNLELSGHVRKLEDGSYAATEGAGAA